MTILRAGTFNVRDYRKDIPLVVKLAVLIRQRCCAPDGKPFTEEDAGLIQFDHDPALVARDFDTDANDFIPPQHDLHRIYAKRKGQHGQKTTGRKEGAEKTVTTRNSDVGEAARARKIVLTEQQHQMRMLAKIIPDAILDELDKLSGKPKRKIASRGFDKGHRPLRSWNNLRRAKR